jgi:hypothetical protein
MEEENSCDSKEIPSAGLSVYFPILFAMFPQMFRLTNIYAFI